MGCFLKKEKTDTCKKLSTNDPAHKKNQRKTQSMLTFSCAARSTLKKVTEKKAASKLCILSFKNDCITFLSGIVIKLLKR